MNQLVRTIVAALADAPENAERTVEFSLDRDMLAIAANDVYPALEPSGRRVSIRQTVQLGLLDVARVDQVDLMVEAIGAAMREHYRDA